MEDTDRANPSIAGRRSFLRQASALSAASLLGVSRALAAEPPPEIGRIRLLSSPAICLAPQYIAEELLRAEGFRDVEYVNQDRSSKAAAHTQSRGSSGFHAVGAFSTLPVWTQRRSSRSRRRKRLLEYSSMPERRCGSQGKTVAIRGFDIGDHVLLSSMLAYVGMDRARRDLESRTHVTDALAVRCWQGTPTAFAPRATNANEEERPHDSRHGTDPPWRNNSAWRCSREFVKLSGRTKRALQRY